MWAVKRVPPSPRSYAGESKRGQTSLRGPGLSRAFSSNSLAEQRQQNCLHEAEIIVRVAQELS